MAKMYYEKDGNLELLKGRKVAVIGFGSQGHAHALNLKESGVDVVVGLYKGSKSWETAKVSGLEVMEVSEAVAASTVTMILIPDEKQKKVFEEDVLKNLK
ncbi:MAG: NAD(P)-dependent oxidoreductase, partial [Lutispora sp.]